MADDDDDDDFEDNIEDAINLFNAGNVKGAILINLRRRRGRAHVNADNELVESGIDEKTDVFNSFAIKAFGLLTQTDKNHVISTLNLIVDFAVLMVGSNGDSYTDLRSFLNFDSYDFDTETLFKAIQTVTRAVNYERYKMVPNYNLLNINRLLLHRSAQTSEKFKIWIKRYFNVEIDKIDFNRDGHRIRDQITKLLRIDLKNKEIQGFQTIIDEKTQLLTLSAVHFICKWQFRFQYFEENAMFFNNGTTPTNITAMRTDKFTCKAANNLEWEALVIELPLANECMNFYFILPKRRTGLPNLLQLFNYVSLMTTLSGLHSIQCNLILPKFKVECDYDFGQQYSHLKIFTSEAELQPIGGLDYKLKVTNMLHKVILETNETGIYDQMPNTIENCTGVRDIKILHPFIFVVKDARTGAFIFVGKIQTL